MNDLLSGLKLSRKLSVVPAIILLFFFLFALVSYWGISKQNAVIESMYTTNFQTSIKAGAFAQTIIKAHANFYKFISWSRANYPPDKLNALSKEELENITSVIKQVKDLQAASTSQDIQTQCKNVLLQLDEYQKSVSTVVDLASFDLNAGTMAMGTAEDKFTSLATSLDLLTKAAITESNTEYENAQANYHLVIYIFFGVLFGSILLSVGAARRINTSIAHPIHTLTEVSQKVSAGDLQVTVPIESNDEIGSLADSLRAMLTYLRDANVHLQNEKSTIQDRVETAVKEVEEQRVYLTESVNTMLIQMQEFATGNLDIHLKVQKDDEIGKLFEGFNESVANIRQIMDSIRQAVQETANASSKISSSSEEMAAGAVEQNAQTNEVAGAVEEMTKTIIETSNSNTMAAEMAKMAGDKAKEGGRVVAETIAGMNKIADVVRKSANTVFALGQNSEKIGEIVQVIDEIADQTNLLALNAAIEAARAGEQGRGFAVVADEVRKLAERTTKATKEIANMIKQIQSDTDEAVVSMKQGTESVEEGKLSAMKAGEVLSAIVESADRVTEIVTQVAAASEQQSATVEEIGKNIEAISNVTNESTTGIQHIAKAAEDLNYLTENLQSLVNKFHTGNDNSFQLVHSGTGKFRALSR